MSRVAANPMPRTSGSFTVYCSSYSSAGLKPFFKQMCAGSAVPGNGVCSHVANAQSVLAMFTTPRLTPAALSDTAEINFAVVVSSVAGGYGDGVARGIVSAAVVPLWPRMRMTSGPVMLLPSGCFARGTSIVWLAAVGTTSPCQPLTSEMCPSGLDEAAPLPRLTTEYISTPLVFDRSIGFIIENVPTYSTLPRALRAASWMSVMSAFFGSAGSSSP
jgi:hypothetical protein